ncbi:uncharacterized protein LOC141815543 isoform X2 [Curcuma longa]|uniref:uncharacterized protein LOC141815543 isoform X2 n=1 Tax=Curcuma longa TaxID=136217 RepID=UPI003D9DC59E
MEERKLLIESSNLTVLLQNQGMYAGAHFPVQPASWSLAALEGRAPTNVFDRRPLFKPVELDRIGDDDSDDSLRRHESKRRLTRDQVRLLEDSFELGDKLEPQRKAQLAKGLGLKPRQIAVWFQNRRARWKTKQLEKDYEALRSIYESLKVDRECLIKEKEELEAEVLSLTKKLLLKERTMAYSKREDINNIIMSSANSTPRVDEEGYNSMLMELAGSSNALGLDDNVVDNSDRSQIGEVVDDASGYEYLSVEDNNSCGGYGLLW